MACLRESEIEKFIAASLSPVMLKVALHVRTCAECRRRVDQAKSDQALLAELYNALREAEWEGRVSGGTTSRMP